MSNTNQHHYRGPLPNITSMYPAELALPSDAQWLRDNPEAVARILVFRDDSPRSFFPALTIDGSLFFSPASIIASPIRRAFKEGWLATGFGSAAGVSGFIKSFLCSFEG
jgi:hypothetical protein